MIAHRTLECSAAAQAARSVLEAWRRGDAMLLRQGIDFADRLLRESAPGTARELEARELVTAVIAELEKSIDSPSSVSPLSPPLDAACLSLLSNVCGLSDRAAAGS